MIILGLDIGGANTKAAILKFRDNVIEDCAADIEYFPFWEKTITEIPEMLKRVTLNLQEQHFSQSENIDFIAITITAELSDAFQTKREGIDTILNALDVVFDKYKLRFISTNNKFLTFDDAQNNYLSISASNWVSTALYLGKFVPNCILIDAGSTTIDVIPIINSIPVSQGKTDVDRMMNHELIYTGGLRATIPSVTHHVPYLGKSIRISFEKFALIADVHRVLENITEQEYINDTADNRSKSMDDCYARLSRVICMDTKNISREDLKKIANFIYEKQINIICREIMMFMDNLILRYKEFNINPKFVITGVAAGFLIRKTLVNLGYNNIINYEEITKIPDRISSSAFAVAGALYYQLM
ncbi:MAG: hydantoinase/oxoprolinase family protein [Promethearchaeota archaeon]|jgi:probable H4MPT-linked C1 transfer pathway protein